MQADNCPLIYALFIGVFILQQMYLWARLIQWRIHVLYPSPVLLWSLFFMGHLYHLSLPNILSPTTLAALSLYTLVGWLLFPRIEGLDYQSPHTYIDVYEGLRQQRHWVFGFAFLAEFLLSVSYWQLGTIPTMDCLIYLGLFLGAFLTEHKGLMLLWVWLGLLYLFF